MARVVSEFDLWNSATALASTAVLRSRTIQQKNSMGTCSLELILAGSSPSVDVKFEVTRDGVNFYSPTDADENDVSIISTALTSSTWIQFSPKIAPHIRIKLTGTASNGADTTVRAYLIFQEEIR